MKSTAAIGVLFFVCMLLLAIAIGIGAWVSVSEKGYRLTGEIFDRPNERPASKQEIEKLAADCLARIKKSIKIALAMVTATFFISAIAVAVRFAPILLAAFAG